MSELTAAVDRGERPSLGQYTLSRRLGQGAMGVVFLGQHNHLQKNVAIKLLHFDRIRHPSAIARFRREMAAVGQLSHANIVNATDAGDADGLHFLVMEYVVGRNLAEVVKDCGKLRIADACEITRQAAMGLGHAHSKGLVHRDVKPSNVLLDSQGQVKILDLGLALLMPREAEPDELALTNHEADRGGEDIDRAGTEITGAGTILGTRAYMSPEQARNSHAVDPRADIYSLGCTLYFLLVGQPPRHGVREQIERTMNLSRFTSRRAITDVRPDLPTELEAVIDKMLSERPEDRQADVDELQHALAPFCQEHNILRLVGKHPESVPPISKPVEDRVTLERDERSPYSAESARSYPILLLVIASLVTAGVVATVLVVGFISYWLAGSKSSDTARGKVRPNSIDVEQPPRPTPPPINAPPEVVRPTSGSSSPREAPVVSPSHPRDAHSFSKVIRLTGQQKIVVEGTKNLVNADREFTAEIWFRLLGQGRMGRDGTLIGNRSGSLPSSPSQIRSEENLWRLVTGGDFNFGGLQLLRGSEFGRSPISTDGSTSLNQGWNHLAVCGTGGKLYAWVNGKQRLVPVQGRMIPSRVRSTPRSVVEGSDLQIGGGDARSPFSSVAVDVMAFRLSDHVRYAEDFEPPGVFEADERTVSLLDFSEGAGDRLHDKSGNQRDGTLRGAQWIDPTTPFGDRYGPGR